MIDSADKNNIETILTKYQLTVPDYQRPYQWKKSEAIEFWEDLMSYYEDYKANTNNAGNLFLGTFIFLEKSNSDYEIVDGQQRITSIFILLIAIKTRLMEINTSQSIKQANAILDILRHLNRATGMVTGSRLKPSESIKQLFNHMVEDNWNGNFEFKNLKLQIRKIEPIYSFFYGELKKEFQPEDYAHLLAAIYGTTVVQIVIKEREDAFAIFERTNARGMDLEASDLLKNYLFSKLKDKDGDVESKWDEIQKNADGTTLRMLKYFYISENGHVTQSQLYKKIKSVSDSPRQLLIKVLDFSNFYLLLRSGNEDNFREYFDSIGLNDLAKDPDTFFRIYSSIEGLRFIKITQVHPLIFSVLNAYIRCELSKDDKYRKTLPLFFRNLENYHFVNNLILDRVGNEVEKPYANFSKKFAECTKESFNQVLKEFYLFLKEKIAPISEFKARFQELSYSQDSYKILLYVFDRFYNFSNSKALKVSAAGYQPIFSPERKFKDLNINIEHWFPQKNAEKLNDPELVHNIGNLLVISSKLNSVLGHASPEDKFKKTQTEDCLKEIRNFPFIQTFITQYEVNHKDWDDAAILKRASDLSEDAYRNVWRFEPPL